MSVTKPSKPLPSKCTIFFDKNTRQIQQFPFPKPIIDYITISSTKIYKKLIKTCKYFYATKPLQILCLHYNDKNVRDWTCSPFGKCWLKHFKIDLDELKLTKIWLTQCLDVYGYYRGPSNILSDLIPKLYRSNIIQLEIANQIITFEEFLFLTPEVRQILFCETIVKNRDGSVVKFEDVIANLPKLKTLIYYFLIDGTDISNETTQNLLNVEHFKNLTEIDLCGISQIFDFGKFADFMNNNKHIIYRLRFLSTVPHFYRNQVQEYIESLKGEKFNPSILFHEPFEEN